jgi:AraC-like DNA-binding protein
VTVSQQLKGNGRRGKRPEQDVSDPAKQEKNDLQTRITELVEEKQLFLIKDLKISDIARELGTNATYISACINGQMGISFPEFISRYRVEYALKLMQEHPEMSSVEVWDASGLNNEKTFFRRFRLQTGMTPAEWKKQNQTK